MARDMTASGNWKYKRTNLTSRYKKIQRSTPGKNKNDNETYNVSFKSSGRRINCQATFSFHSATTRPNAFLKHAYCTDKNGDHIVDLKDKDGDGKYNDYVENGALSGYPFAVRCYSDFNSSKNRWSIKFSIEDYSG